MKILWIIILVADNLRPLLLAYFYEYFNRLLDTYLFLWYNNRVEYLSPEAVYRSTVMPD